MPRRKSDSWRQPRRRRSRNDGPSPETARSCSVACAATRPWATTSMPSPASPAKPSSGATPLKLKLAGVAPPPLSLPMSVCGLTQFVLCLCLHAVSVSSTPTLRNAWSAHSSCVVHTLQVLHPHPHTPSASSTSTHYQVHHPHTLSESSTHPKCIIHTFQVLHPHLHTPSTSSTSTPHPHPQCVIHIYTLLVHHPHTPSVSSTHSK